MGADTSQDTQDRPPAAATPEEAILTRRSVRAYLPDPVDEATVRRLLELAARAPSGTNTQPWKVHALAGEAKKKLCDAIMAVRDEEPMGAPGNGSPEYDYYPSKWRDPYLARRRKVGWDLYSLLGIEKGDKERMWEHFNRNYRFFDAPVGLIFTIDRDLELGSWLDYGMFVENIMIAARGLGLDTCPQAAWMQYPQTIAEVLDLPEEQMVVCGMAVGYADRSQPEDALVTDREPVDEFARFTGF